MKKIKVLRIINRFNLGGPTYNATFLTKFLGDEFETMLIGGLPEEGEADSLHILEQYGVEPVLLPEMQRIPNLQSDRKAYKKIRKRRHLRSTQCTKKFFKFFSISYCTKKMC